MSDVYQGPGWTKASDGKWYPPEQEPTSTGGEEAHDKARPESQLPTDKGTSPHNLVESVDIPSEALDADDAGMPAAWYPDPVDPASFRYWDGGAWTQLTKVVLPPIPASINDALSAESGEAKPIERDVVPSATAATDIRTKGAEQQAEDASSGHEEPVHHWVREADKAVATAWTVGTPTAWRSAAQAAVVVAEIAQTMRVTTHEHQLAKQLTQAAEEAVHEAHAAKHAADDAMRTAERTAQAADEAARAAQIAVEEALTARRKVEQTTQEAPKAVESARLATQTAATAKAKADHLDQIVIKAREANTPEAWSEALQIATEAWGDGDRLKVVSNRR